MVVVLSSTSGALFYYYDQGQQPGEDSLTEIKASSQRSGERRIRDQYKVEIPYLLWEQPINTAVNFSLLIFNF